MLYCFRNCQTCHHERIPKASHCGACGHCVIGWDHHCDALNNCIGRRNIRSFVCFLVLSYAFAITIFLSCLFLLLVGRVGYCPTGMVQRIGTLAAAIFIGTFHWVYRRFWRKRNLKNKILFALVIMFVASTTATTKSFVASVA